MRKGNGPRKRRTARTGPRTTITLKRHPVEVTRGRRGITPTRAGNITRCDAPFEWGRERGSKGQRQLATAILLEICGRATAVAHSERFEHEMLSGITHDRWEIDVDDITAWVSAQSRGSEARIDHEPEDNARGAPTAP